ncbi:hypothetical protein FACS189450_03660 [Spirochaetia bacterium]|nr:hypothetical protein FACS189450_03660 [Spirochaetia bacterium]
MKKFLLSSVMVLAVLSLIFTACEQPNGDTTNITSSTDGTRTSGGEGVLGQVTGIVTDVYTQKPLSGVTVTIGDKSGTTNDAGIYFVKDVKPGSYSAVLSKSGYVSTYATAVNVLASDYIADDPFLEVEALRDQLLALREWAQNQGPAFAGSSGDWTYTGGGIFVSADGTTAVSIDNTLNVKEIKLDFTYRKVYNIANQSLNPLVTATGIFKVVKVTTPSNYTYDQLISTVIPEPIKQAAASGKVFLMVGSVRCGPLEFDANGKFTLANVPYGFTLSVDGFQQDDYYYTGGGTTYRRNSTNGITTSAWGSLPVINNTVDVGEFYLGTAGKFDGTVKAETGATPALISSINRLAKDGTITLTFGEEIEKRGFAVIITNRGNTSTSTYPTLAYEWTSPKTVEITPIIGGFWPYSTNEEIRIGTISAGTVVTTDGTNIAFNPIEIFTNKHLQLLSVTPRLSGDVGSRAAVVDKGGAVDLKFNKNLDASYPGSTATIQGSPVDFQIGGTVPADTLRVYVDAYYNNQPITYTVASADWTDDALSAETDAGNVTTIAGATQTQVTPTVGLLTTVAGPSISYTGLSPDADIIVTFNKNINLVGTPTLRYNANGQVTVNGVKTHDNSIKFAPTSLLLPSTAYTVDYTVEANGVFTPGNFTVTTAAISPNTWAQISTGSPSSTTSTLKKAVKTFAVTTNDLQLDQGGQNFELKLTSANHANIDNTRFAKVFNAYVGSSIYAQEVLTAMAGTSTLGKGNDKTLSSSFNNNFTAFSAGNPLPGATPRHSSDDIYFVVTTQDDNGYYLAQKTGAIQFTPITLTADNIEAQYTLTGVSPSTTPYTVNLSWPKEEGVTYTATRQPLDTNNNLTGTSTSPTGGITTVVNGFTGDRTVLIDRPAIRTKYRYTITASHTALGTTTTKTVTYDLSHRDFAPLITGYLVAIPSSTVYEINVTYASTSAIYTGDLVVDIYRTTANVRTPGPGVTRNVEVANWPLTAEHSTSAGSLTWYDNRGYTNTGTYYVYRAVIKSDGTPVGSAITNDYDDSFTGGGVYGTGSPGTGFDGTTDLVVVRPSVPPSISYLVRASSGPAGTGPLAQYKLVYTGSSPLAGGAKIYLNGSTTPLGGVSSGLVYEATGNPQSTTAAALNSGEYHITITGLTTPGTFTLYTDAVDGTKLLIRTVEIDGNGAITNQY